MINVVTASTLLSYALYTLSPDTVARFGSTNLVFTLPFVLFGIFRYLYLVHQKDQGGSPTQVVLRDRWLSPEENYGITLVNRSGMVTIPEVGIGAISEPLKRRCFYPFYSIVVDYDGAVLLCTHDWGKKFIVGNVNHQTIHALWDNDRIKKVRESLANANRGFAPCSGCDADGTLMGGEHFDQWMGHYKESVNESI